MTTTELLKSLTANTIVTAEMEQKAQELLARNASAQAERNSKNKKKKAEENAPLITACTELLNDGKGRMASEIATALGITTSKATFIAKAVPEVKIGDAKVKGRTVKVYSL